MYCTLIFSSAALGTMELPSNALNPLDRFFPLQSRQRRFNRPDRLAERAVRLEAFYGTLSTPIPGEAADENPLFPGQQYILWSSHDQTGIPHKSFARIISLASSITGIECGAIEAAVARMEGRLLILQGKPGPYRKRGDIPWEGYESRTFGALRTNGGASLVP